VCYLRPGTDVKEFGEVQFFIRAVTTNQEVKHLAWVRHFENIDIDREKRIARFRKRAGRRSWVDAVWILSPIGVIRDRDKDFIISDANLFD
jgi:hypothetical protein